MPSRWSSSSSGQERVGPRRAGEHVSRGQAGIERRRLGPQREPRPSPPGAPGRATRTRSASRRPARRRPAPRRARPARAAHARRGRRHARARGRARARSRRGRPSPAARGVPGPGARGGAGSRTRPPPSVVESRRTTWSPRAATTGVARRSCPKRSPTRTSRAGISAVPWCTWIRALPAIGSSSSSSTSSR